MIKKTYLLPSHNILKRKSINAITFVILDF